MLLKQCRICLKSYKINAWCTNEISRRTCELSFKSTLHRFVGFESVICDNSKAALKLLIWTNFLDHH